MSAEPIRRSSRKTKGINNRRLQEEQEELELAQQQQQLAVQHQQDHKKRKLNSDSPSPASTSTTTPTSTLIKKKITTKKQKQKKPKVEVPAKEEVRCLPCGANDLTYDEDNDTLGDMVCCDKCQTWQHIKCMFGKKKKSIKNYLCNVCDPENKAYKNLKLAFTYEDYIKMRFPKQESSSEEEEEEEEGEEEGGGGGGGGEEEEEEAEEQKEEEEIEEDYEVLDSGAVPDDDDNDYEDTKAKDEHEDIEMDHDGNEEEENGEANKKISLKSNGNRKSKESIKTKKTEITPSLLTDANKSKSRQPVIQAFENVFKKQISEEVADTHNKSIDELAKEWSKSLEDALFRAFPPDSNDYPTKSRTFLFNLKKANLMKKIVSNDYTFDQIVHLSATEMLSDEIKVYADEVRKQSIAQTVLTTNKEKVKIRRTHKGEEIVEADYQFDNPDSKYVEDARLDEIEKLKEEKRSHELEEQQHQQQLKEDDDMFDQMSFEREQSAGPLSLNAHYTPTDIGDEEYGNTHHGNDATTDLVMDDDDEFDKILAGGNSTTLKNNHIRPEDPKKESEEEDDDDYDPLNISSTITTPTITAPTSDIVWTGQLTFPNSVSLAAKFLACTSNNPKQDLENAKLIMSEYPREEGLGIDGRLPNNRADDYLSQIIQSRHLYLFELLPNANSVEDRIDNEVQFEKVWGYFNKKSKYGVVGGNPEYIKDGYLAALSNDQLLVSKNPQSFLRLFDNQFQRDVIVNHNNVLSGQHRLFLVLVAKQDLSYLGSHSNGNNLNLNNVLNALT